MFVPAAFLIAGTSAWSIGKGLKDIRLAWRLFWQIGLAAAVTFLTINLIMESAGWAVGAPGAAQRLTMITVLDLGLLGTTLVGGGMMGWLLSAREMADLTHSRGTMLLDESESASRNIG